MVWRCRRAVGDRADGIVLPAARFAFGVADDDFLLVCLWLGQLHCWRRYGGWLAGASACSSWLAGSFRFVGHYYEAANRRSSTMVGPDHWPLFIAAEVRICDGACARKCSMRSKAKVRPTLIRQMKAGLTGACA